MDVIIKVIKHNMSKEKKIKNKNICGIETFINRERYLALKIPTSRTAHTDSERDNTPVKQ
jgi:hypothetical protein